MAVGVSRKYVVLLAMLGLGLVAKADDSHDPDVLLAQNNTYGQYLTDFKQRPIYMFAKDSKDTSTCYDQCAINWPPLSFEDKSEPVAGRGLDEKLIGYIKRKDGKVQVTFGGWPLYYYAKDQTSMSFTGQGVGGNWFLLSPKAEAIKTVAPAQQATAATQATTQPAQTQKTQAQQTQTQQAQPAQPNADQTAAIAKLSAEGKEIFAQYCAACHGPEGRGGAGPNLVNINPLKNTSFVSRQIVGGGEQMPAFGNLLNDHQVSAVGTFVRNAWGNAYGIITEEDAKAARQ